MVEVMINGEGYLTTGIKTVLDAATRPETETQGYVIYQQQHQDQILETVFDHVSKHGEGTLKTWRTAEYFCYVSKCPVEMFQLFGIFTQSEIC